MKLSLIMMSLFTMVSTALPCDEHGQTGFLPENDLWISVDAKREGGISEEQFNAVIDRAIEVYGPIIEEQDAELNVLRLWSSGTVNAYATRRGNEWVVGMYGGLARREEVTEDGFALVVCHEIGHHLAGAPRKGTRWASNEGQSDYWGTLKCFRKYAAEDNNVEIVAAMENVPELVKETCAAQFEDANDAAICVRGAMGGLSLGTLLNNLRRNDDPVNFDTPDTSVASSTDDSHPAPQCRLDSYYQGALCTVLPEIDTDQDNADIGTCNRTENFELGLKPLCWFKPESSDDDDDSDVVITLPDTSKHF